MASIGGATVLTMEGQHPLAPATIVGDITRPRIDGHAYLDVGKRGDVARIVTEIDCADPEAVKATYRAKQGTLVTVILPDSESISNVMVRRVVPLSSKRVLTPVGGINTGLWILTTMWVLQATGV